MRSVGALKNATAALVGTTALATVLVLLAAGPVAAQSVFVSSNAPIDAKPTDGRRPASAKANSETGAMTFGDFIVSGQLIAGGVYNDNLYQSRYNKVSDWGINFQPSFKVDRSVGLHTTSLTGVLSSQFYLNNSNGNTTTGNLALSHIYEVQRDLVAYVQGHVARNLNTNPSIYTGLNVRLDPSYFNEEYLSGSLEKSFDRFSVGMGAQILGQQYDNISDTAGRRYQLNGNDGTATTVIARFGYAVTPTIKAFVQPSYNWQNFNASLNNSQGYTIVAGLQTDRIGLFRGEIYGGFASQDFTNLNRTRTAPTFGGSISYFPTRDLTFTASLTQNFGLTQGVAFQGGTGQTTTASLSAQYAFSQTLTLGANIGYSQISYDQSAQKQEQWGAGVTANYMFSAHLGVNAGYSFTRVEYNIGPGGYDRNLVTLGATARF
ncbi:MAG: outer membrane beta-barrel protein [Alsobacter sp.]